MKSVIIAGVGIVLTILVGMLTSLPVGIAVLLVSHPFLHTLLIDVWLSIGVGSLAGGLVQWQFQKKYSESIEHLFYRVL